MKRLLLVLACLTSACVPIPRPPQARTIVWTITGQGEILPSSTGILTPDVGSPVTCATQQVTGKPRLACQTTATGGGSLAIDAPQYQSRTVRTRDLTRFDQGEVELTPIGGHLPRVFAAGKVWKLETGEPITLIGLSEFQLLRIGLEGGAAAIEARLDHLDTLRLPDGRKFNYLRVFMMMNGNLGRLIPGEYNDRYWQTITLVSDAAARHGYYVEWTAFVDATQVVPDDVGDQLDFWSWTCDHLKPLTNVFAELGNELDQPINRLARIEAFGRCDGVLSSHGSYGSEAVPPRPAWDYEVAHTNDAFQWWRKSHFAMELSDDMNVPAWIDETTRPDRDADLSHHRGDAVTGVLLAAGKLFHSTAGRDGQPYDGVNRDAALAVLEAAYGVPLHCQSPEPYRHRSDLEQPDAGATGQRAYQRGDDPACVRVTPTP